MSERPPSPDRFGWSEIALHWGMAVLLAALYASIEVKDQFPRGDPLRLWLVDLHRSLGLLVFALVWLRLWLRATGWRPPIRPPLSDGQEFIARLFHYTLYIMMVLMPVTGYVMTNAAGGEVWLGAVPLPRVAGPDPILAATLGRIHALVGNAGYVMIAAHTLAALGHHYGRRDNTLARMLPWTRSRRDRP